MSTSPESVETPASPAALGLSGKQVEVLALLMQGRSNKVISRALNLAEPTVKYHVTTILKALKVTNRTEAVLAVGKLGWTLPPVAEDKPSAETPAGPESAVEPGARAAIAACAARPVTSAKEIALDLPDKPSVVVLPFTNLSGDTSQDYFADGMVEEITVALGRLPWLFVIASASAFTYKGRALDVRRIGAELGVRYVLKGSVRKEANRVRITAQLANAVHGNQVWADHFDGGLDNVFEMQEQVAAQVSTTISPALRSEEFERARKKPPENLTAYDLYLRALPIHRASADGNQEALRLLNRAVELDRSYGAAYALAAHCYDLQKVACWVPATDSRLQEGVRLAHLAVETGTNDSEALWMSAHALMIISGQLDLARSLVDRAISLNPSSSNAWWVSGGVHHYLGNSEIALEHGARARRLNPLDTVSFRYWMPTILAHFFAGRYFEALDAAEKSLVQHSNFPSALRFKIASCGLLGRIEDGRITVERLLRIVPHASIAEERAYMEPLLRRNLPGLKTYLKGMRLAGLPEGEAP